MGITRSGATQARAPYQSNATAGFHISACQWPTADVWSLSQRRHSLTGAGQTAQAYYEMSSRPLVLSEVPEVLNVESGEW